MPRVIGTDPGTSSLDLLLLEDGLAIDQVRIEPSAFRDDPEILRRWIERRSPVDLIAGPSGYGLPLVPGDRLTDTDLDQMALIRPDEAGASLGVLGFRSWVRAIVACGKSTVFLPGGVHLPTIPDHRKVNSIDLGTADKVCVAALALRMHTDRTGEPAGRPTFAVAEIGSAFTSILVVKEGSLVDAASGTRGPIGLRSSGAWDGEVAYRLSPLSKADLFRGGFADLGNLGPAAFVESLRKHVAGLRAVTPFDLVYLSGRGMEREDVASWAREALEPIAPVIALPDLPGVWVKHAAQGSALIADGLAGGRHADLVDALALRRASGTIADWLRIRGHPAGKGGLAVRPD